MTESGRLGAFITKVKKGSLADVVGHLRAGIHLTATLGSHKCWEGIIYFNLFCLIEIQLAVDDTVIRKTHVYETC